MKRDPDTLDLFSGAPIVARYEEERVRAATLNERITRAAGAALKDFMARTNFATDRKAIAAEMSEYLGERVTENMLNQYASQANLEHAIPAHRLIALAIVTGDARLINALLQDTGLVAVEEKYEPLIRREIKREQIDKLQRELNAADGQWRSRR